MSVLVTGSVRGIQRNMRYDRTGYRGKPRAAKKTKGKTYHFPAAREAVSRSVGFVRRSVRRVLSFFRGGSC
jgi:hypothetical protein